MTANSLFGLWLVEGMNETKEKKKSKDTVRQEGKKIQSEIFEIVQFLI